MFFYIHRNRNAVKTQHELYFALFINVYDSTLARGAFVFAGSLCKVKLAGVFFERGNGSSV